MYKLWLCRISARFKLNFAEPSVVRLIVIANQFYIMTVRRVKKVFTSALLLIVKIKYTTLFLYTAKSLNTLHFLNECTLTAVSCQYCELKLSYVGK